MPAWGWVVLAAAAWALGRAQRQAGAPASPVASAAGGAASDVVGGVVGLWATAVDSLGAPLPALSPAQVRRAGEPNGPQVVLGRVEGLSQL